jgi:putative acetyltransferase
VNRADYTEEQVEARAPAVPDKRVWHARMSESDRRTLVAEEDGEVVGFAELEDDGHLDMLYLRRDAVGRGVGRRLYEAIEGEAKGSGVERIFTEASITARSFFDAVLRSSLPASNAQATAKIGYWKDAPSTGHLLRW